jgi:heme iron utilization protein
MDEGEIYEKIYEIMTNQQFGVLATIENGVPHSSIVAFTVTNSLRTILFLTKQDGRKYKNISTNPLVTILVDHRPLSSKKIAGSFAITASGQAKPVDLKSANATKELFLFCHPSLTEYLDDPSFALVSIMVSKYEISNGISEVYPYKIG